MEKSGLKVGIKILGAIPDMEKTNVPGDKPYK